MDEQFFFNLRINAWDLYLHVGCRLFDHPDWSSPAPSLSPHVVRMVADAAGFDGLDDDWLALPQTTLELNLS